MKKIKLLLFSLIAIVLLTGCGTKTLTCTMTEEDSGLSMEQQIIAEFKNNEVQKLKISVDSIATNDLIKENWDIFAEALSSEFEPTEKEGIKITTENNKEKYSYKVSMEFDLTKANKEDLSEYDVDDIANEKSRLEDVKKAAEESGYTCK